MALYVYVCEHCGTMAEEFRPMERRDDAPVCALCGETMRRKQQPTPHRWMARNGVEIRAPGSEWDWPDGKPFDHAEFVKRNPKANAKPYQRKVVSLG